MSACRAPPIGVNVKPDRICVATHAPRRANRLAYLALLAIGAGVVLAASQGLGFSRSVTPGLVEHFAAGFGPGSRTRIGGWQEFVRSFPAEQRQHSANELELLSSVNTFFNRLPFVADMAHWGVEDYWASPAETFASNGGDCEDFSIAKYFALMRPL